MRDTRIRSNHPIFRSSSPVASRRVMLMLKYQYIVIPERAFHELPRLRQSTVGGGVAHGPRRPRTSQLFASSRPSLPSSLRPSSPPQIPACIAPYSPGSNGSRLTAHTHKYAFVKSVRGPCGWHNTKGKPQGVSMATTTDCSCLPASCQASLKSHESQPRLGRKFAPVNPGG